ncbi:VanW like protein [Planococcus massiliensis]|uniref:VanW like protein n=1 Tax=Planococcus massiliensis TaxID=1499687 RepID=A0A098EMR6_9BACL|nr:VanW family protein [Planococcus massiliensis]CEG23087.1 VanW like protein [Planococcus massiliensis]
MDNKVFGTTFLAIILSAFLFFGVANAGALAVDKWFFPVEKFGDNTYIGATDVSNMEVTEAKQLFAGRVESWKQSAQLIVTYQDATANYPLDNAQILLDETVQRAQSGSQNNFVFELSDATTQTFLAEQFPSAVFSNEEIQSVTTKLEESLHNGQAETRITISDDNLSVEREVVSSVSFNHNLQSKGAQAALAALDGFQIAPNAQFSLIGFLEEQGLQQVSDEELTEIASAIYGVVLQSNFIIDERSIGTKMPAAIPLGQEAAINRALNVDFVFTNPNYSSFILNIGTNGAAIEASMTGLPFVYSYSVQIGEQEEVKPRLIKQYSAFVSNGSTVKEPGADGVRLNVSRLILAQGEELEIEPISTDFYPPTHRIEVYPLTSTEVVPEGGEIIDPATGEVTTPGSTDSTPGDTVDPSTGTDGTGSSSGDTGIDGSGSSTDGSQTGGNGAASGSENNNSGTGNTGNSNNAGGSENNNSTGAGNNGSAPTYDKGGNIINP